LAGDDSPVKFNFLNFDPIPLLLDPEVKIRGIIPDKIKVFKVMILFKNFFSINFVLRVQNYLFYWFVKQFRVKNIQLYLNLEMILDKINLFYK
jgi:hypothetical protein